VFDLDGTLVRGDTLRAYVFGYLVRRPWRLPLLLAVIPATLRFLARRDHGALKAAFIRATLGGQTRTALAAWTARFVARVVRRGLFRDARARLERHRRYGDVLVLLSASPDLYVPAIGAALGFTQVVCTGLKWEGERLDGHLTTPNRRGEEKVRCLEQLKAEHPRQQFAAYGNAASDLPHLRMADRPLLVNGSRRARAAARRYGVPQATWR